MKEDKIILLVVIQILLLTLFIPARTYSIRESFFFNEQNKIDELKNENSLFNLLVSFFSIKQIGIVSAQSNNFWCCSETISGASCQPLEPGDPESICPDSNEKQTPCESTTECKTGTCIDRDSGTCSVGTKQICEQDGGEWNSGEINSIKFCQTGCCTIGERKIYTSYGRCNLTAELEDKNYDFDSDVTEEECRFLTEERGACLLNNGDCRVTTEIDCIQNLDRGDTDFYEGILCTSPELNTNCEPTEETICSEDGRVYFIDSCGNRANIYDSDKIFDGNFNGNSDDNYWIGIVSPENSCKVNLNKDNSVEGCGNCLIGKSTCVSEGETNFDADYGNYVCRDTKCVDAEGNIRLNGESWCVYESYVGDSRDVVGSLHWVASCNDGEINYDKTDNWRGMVCGEYVREEDGKEVSIAISRGNEGFMCLLANKDIGVYEYDEDSGEAIKHDKTFEKNNETCLETSSDCRLEHIDIGDYFKFDICVPKYPKGFDLADDLPLNEEDRDY